MVLVDTSVWIEFLRSTGSDHHRWLRHAVDDPATHVAWTEPVLHELVSGVSGEDEATELGRMLRHGPVLPMDGLVDWADAARLRRAARRNGRPVRSAIDSLVAAVALRTATPVIARDSDFSRLAAVSELHLVEP